MAQIAELEQPLVSPAATAIADPDSPRLYFAGLPFQSQRRMTEVEVKRLRRSYRGYKFLSVAATNVFLGVCVLCIYLREVELLGFLVGLPLFAILLYRFHKEVLSPIERSITDRLVNRFAHDNDPGGPFSTAIETGSGGWPINRRAKVGELLFQGNRQRTVGMRAPTKELSPSEREEIEYLLKRWDSRLRAAFVRIFCLFWILGAFTIRAAFTEKSGVFFLFIQMSGLAFLALLRSPPVSQKSLRLALETSELHAKPDDPNELCLADGTLWFKDGLPASWRTGEFLSIF